MESANVKDQGCQQILYFNWRTSEPAIQLAMKKSREHTTQPESMPKMDSRKNAVSP
jgi:hypothetical protein